MLLKLVIIICELFVKKVKQTTPRLSLNFKQDKILYNY